MIWIIGVLSEFDVERPRTLGYFGCKPDFDFEFPKSFLKAHHAGLAEAYNLNLFIHTRMFTIF